MNITFVKKYFKYSWPIIFSQFIILCSSNISVALMGSLSQKAISGYTLANESFNFFSMIALGLAGSFHIYISQYYGAKAYNKCNQVLKYGNKICLLISVLCSLFFFVCANPFIGLFAKDKEIISYGVEYLQIFAWTFIPYIMNLLWSTMFSFIDKPKVTMIAGVMDSIVTVVLCYLFLNYFHFGKRGAALAILLGRITESIYLLYSLVYSKSIFDLKAYVQTLSFEEKKNILLKSGPLILNESIFSIAFIIIMKNYSYVSEISVGCITVVNYIQQLFYICNKGAEPIVGTLVGTSIGKGDYFKAKQNAKYTIILLTLCGVVGTLLMVIFSSTLPILFSFTGDLKTLCTKMILAKASISIFGGNTLVFYHILRIGGNTKEVFVYDGLFTLIIPLGVSILFSRVFKVSFLILYILIESMNIIKTLLGIYLFRKGSWIKKL